MRGLMGERAAGMDSGRVAFTGQGARAARSHVTLEAAVAQLLGKS